jgi:hypothetical protein
MTSEAIRNATSLPAPDSGPSQRESQDGPIIGPSGPARARVRVKASRVNVVAPTIQGICGPTSFASSVPAGPLSSWESKLRLRLARIGSTERALIWKASATPQGRSISRLVPWTPPISDNACGGSPWPTPTARDGMPPHKAEYVAKHKANGHGMSNLNDTMAFTGGYWPTVTVHGNHNRKGLSPTSGDGLATVMRDTSMWPTPLASELSRGGQRYAQGGTPLKSVMTGLWSTPRASDGEKGSPNQEFSGGGQPLPAQMHANGLSASPWLTPTARDWKDSEGMSLEPRKDGASRVDLLPRQLIATARGGPAPNGSTATTEKRGAPNPAFACWLMGWPDELTSAALQGIQSSRKSRPKSLRRTSKTKPSNIFD